MSYLYRLDVLTDFAETETLKRWLALAAYECLGTTFDTEETAI